MENIVFHKNGIQNNNSKRVSFLNEVTRSSSFILEGVVAWLIGIARWLDLRNEEAVSFYMPVTFSLFLLSVMIDESKIFN